MYASRACLVRIMLWIMLCSVCPGVIRDTTTFIVETTPSSTLTFTVYTSGSKSSGNVTSKLYDPVVGAVKLWEKVSPFDAVNSATTGAPALAVPLTV